MKKNTSKQQSTRYCDLYDQKHHNFTLMMVSERADDRVVRIGAEDASATRPEAPRLCADDVIWAGRYSVGPSRSRKRLRH